MAVACARCSMLTLSVTLPLSSNLDESNLVDEAVGGHNIATSSHVHMRTCTPPPGIAKSENSLTLDNSRRIFAFANNSSYQIAPFAKAIP